MSEPRSENVTPVPCGHEVAILAQRDAAWDQLERAEAAMREALRHLQADRPWDAENVLRSARRREHARCGVTR